jgi:hypothetical protein
MRDDEAQERLLRRSYTIFFTSMQVRAYTTTSQQHHSRYCLKTQTGALHSEYSRPSARSKGLACRGSDLSESPARETKHT